MISGAIADRYSVLSKVNIATSESQESSICPEPKAATCGGDHIPSTVGSQTAETECDNNVNFFTNSCFFYFLERDVAGCSCRKIPIHFHRESQGVRDVISRMNRQNMSNKFGGEGEIRTLGRVLHPTAV